MILTRPVTAKNAGRSLPGLRPLRDVEAELRPAPTLQEEGRRLGHKERAEGGSAEGKGLIEQIGEVGGALGLAIVGGPASTGANTLKAGEELGKNSPLAAQERTANKQAEASAEEAKGAVESVGEWAGELSGLLSRNSLQNLGKIVAGGLLLLIAVLLFTHAMGGPAPSLGKIPIAAAIGG